MEPGEIELREVKSSNISRVGYDAEKCVLVVEFKSGTKYSFFGVTVKEHAELLKAKSVGSHFHARIRNKYEGTKIVSL